MRVCVVPGLYFKSYSRFTEPRIPFETLALCAVVSAVPNCTCVLVDFNTKGESANFRDGAVHFPALSLDACFYERAGAALAKTDASVFLFSLSIHTNGNLYHSAKIAECLRRLVPSALIIFLGLGPSSRHQDLLRAYTSIDAVVRGEVEATIAELVAKLAAGAPGGLPTDLSSVAGLTFRHEGSITVNPERPLIEDLDSLPLPALHLYGDVIRQVSAQTGDVKYLSVEEHIHIEAGRGCPFTCSFCSNEHLWRRRYRLKSPTRLVEEIRICTERFGARKFLLHQQLFTANKRKTLAFCEALIKSQLAIEWSCFTRNDCVDSDLLAAMKSSGCATIMFGVESGSQRIQDLTRKRMRLPNVAEQIALTIEHGIRPQLSFIVGFPEEQPEDLQQTLEMYLRYKFEDEVESQIGLLSPAGGTDVLARHEDELEFDGVSTTTWYTRFFDEASFEEVRKLPLVFPQNHHVRTPNVPRAVLKFVKALDIAASFLTRSFKYVVQRRLVAIPFQAHELYEDFSRSGDHAPSWDGELRWGTDLSAILLHFARFLDHVVAPLDADGSVLRNLVAFELRLAMLNIRLREQTYETLCTSTPATALETRGGFSVDPAVGLAFDCDYSIEELMVFCNELRRGARTPRKRSTRCVLRAVDSSHIAIEQCSNGELSRWVQSVFRQVEF